MNLNHSPAHGVLALTGRALLSAIFIISGFSKIGGFAATAGYMTSKGLPFAELLLMATIAIELGGGLLLLLGWHARLAAIVIFLFLIPVTFIFHGFWNVGPEEMQGQMIHFMKNLAIMGGMLMVAAHGPGPYALSRKTPG